MRMLTMMSALLLLFLAAVTFANPVMSENRDIAFPPDIVNDTTAISTYTITNNTPVNFTGVTLRNLGGATQVVGAGLCGAAPFALSTGASCILQLDFSATATGSISGGPEVCPDSTGMNCSQPTAAQRISMDVVATPQPSMPSLTVPSNLQLVPGTASTITITNTSTTQIANNVTIAMSSSVRANFDSVGSCTTIAIGGSCQLSLTAKASVSSLPVSTFTVRGSNTQDASLPVQLLTNNIELTVPSSLQLVPGEAATLPITNTSSTETATTVTLTMPSSLSSQFDSIGSCASIAPGATCDLALTPKSSLSSLPVSEIIVSGSNTQETSLALTLAGVSLLASDVTFTTTGEQSLTLTNESDVAVTVSGVSLAGTINNVTVGTVPGTCTDLAAGASCVVPITAGTTSYGNGDITTSYTTGSNLLTAISALAVANTTLTVNSGSDIEIDPTSSTIKSISNTGNFAWQGVAVALATLSGVTLDATSCTSAALAPGASCNITVTASGATAGTSAAVTAGGANVADTAVTVSVNDAIVTSLDMTNVHLQDRAIKIDNQGNTEKTLGNPLVSISAGLTNRIVECPNGESNCNNQSTCVAGAALSAGSSCLIWIEAQEPAGESLGSVSGTVTVKTTASDATIFDVGYGLDLYIATDNKTGGTSYGTVYRWDGSTSTGIGNSNSGTFTTGFRALAVYQGDLYTVGKFSTAGGVAASNIAKWDGSAWTALGSGLTSGSTSADGLTVYDNKLVAGGSFWVAGGVSARLVAEWDGSSWSAMGAGSTSNATVYAVQAYNGDLVAAGNFTQMRDTLADRIAEWNGTIWAALGTGVDSPYILTMTTYNSDLIIGGWFDQAGGTTVKDIASWNGTAWSSLGSGVDAAVRALTVHDGSLIAGGSFTDASGTSASRIAQWDGANWSALSGATFNSYLTALTSYNGKIFAGGRFTTPASYEVEWDGASTWSKLTLGGNIDNQDPKAAQVLPRIASIAAQ